MLMRGQAAPPGMRSGSGGVSIVHGHPMRPAGGAGSALSVGQRIAYHNVRATASPSRRAQCPGPSSNVRSFVCAAPGGITTCAPERRPRARGARSRLGAVAARLRSPEVAVVECRHGARRVGAVFRGRRGDRLPRSLRSLAALVRRRPRRLQRRPLLRARRRAQLVELLFRTDRHRRPRRTGARRQSALSRPLRESRRAPAAAARRCRAGGDDTSA